MAIRTTIEIPESLHNELSQQAEVAGTSVNSLIVVALQQAFRERVTSRYVSGALVKGIGKLGAEFPLDTTPHDLILP